MKLKTGRIVITNIKISRKTDRNKSIFNNELLKNWL